MAYEIYSDESGCGKDRYEAIGTLSATPVVIGELRLNLKETLERHSTSSCEFKKIRGATQLACATELLKTIFDCVVSGNARVMVLVWDKHDSRHTVPGRDDLNNLSIMYYHALKVTKRMWMDRDMESEFYPDELSKVDFNNIISFVENGRLRKESSVVETLFGTEFKRLFPKIINHQEIESKSDPLIQVIDILTGIARLSYEESTQYQEWKKSRSPQISLFEQPQRIIPSKSIVPKFILTQNLDQWFKDKKMQIALESTCGLRTYRPSCGFFFWKYAPMRVSDKAPTKNA